MVGAGHIYGGIFKMECVTRPHSNDTTTMLRVWMYWRDHKGGSQVPCQTLQKV
jgi:hypothetical protein